MARSSKLFGPGLEQPSLAQIAAHITDDSCIEGDCERQGTPCEGCQLPFCNEHANNFEGERLCESCQKIADENRGPQYPSERERGWA